MSTSVAAIVLAGGSGSRIQGDVNKVYLPIGGRPMLVYSLEALDLSPRVSRVVVVAREDDTDVAERLVAEAIRSKPAQVVHGGASRHLSERAGLEALRGAIESGEVGLVAIHDGARPFLTVELLDRLIEAAERHDGAIPGIPIAEPLYRRGIDTVELVQPDTMQRVQTPQVFRAVSLLAAYEASADAGFEGVDTAETVERFTDIDVMVVRGDARNVKVTFVEDFYAAEEHATEWDEGSWL